MSDVQPEEESFKEPCVVIVGGNGRYGVFARGADLADAKKQFRKFDGLLTKSHMIATFDGVKSRYAGVTDMGSLQWYGERPEIVEVIR